MASYPDLFVDSVIELDTNSNYNNIVISYRGSLRIKSEITISKSGRLVNHGVLVIEPRATLIEMTGGMPGGKQPATFVATRRSTTVVDGTLEFANANSTNFDFFCNGRLAGSGSIAASTYKIQGGNGSFTGDVRPPEI
jgi:hypothetical protein